MLQNTNHTAEKMGSLLRWQQQNSVLSLAGELTSDTVSLLWAQRQNLLQQTLEIDVSQLERVDSIGLALLVNFCITGVVSTNAASTNLVSTNKKIRLCNITPRLATLITLYNLQQLFPINDIK